MSTHRIDRSGVITEIENTMTEASLILAVAAVGVFITALASGMVGWAVVAGVVSCGVLLDGCGDLQARPTRSDR